MNSKASKTVVVNLGKGDLSHGFPKITVRLWVDQSLFAEQILGSLPACTKLEEAYRIWQSTYRALCGRLVLRLPSSDISEDELEIDSGGITHISQQSFEEFSQQLQQQINAWLKSEGFLNVERQLRSHLSPADEIRVIFETTDDTLHRLPWHCWDFFRDYPDAEMALSRPEYKRQKVRDREAQRTVRILAVLGDRQGIDVEAEQQLLQGIADADVQFLVTPSRQEFDHYLWDTIGWDMLFFAGHSRTEGETGRIYINESPIHNSLTIEQLEEALHTALENGLKLVIFNSCDGVGLAQELGKLHIPHVIVMREPVPNRVAQVFLKYFLDAFAGERLSLHRAMRQARRRLQGLEDQFPGASWLPVLCQNPSVEPTTWLQLGGVAPCPYRGLFAFQEADAHLFFGREQVTQDLMTAVKQKSLVVVVGPSGSGKSSVVFAGLIPHLRSRKGSTTWQIISCRPGDTPFDALAEALIKLEPSQSERTTDDRLQVLELAVELQRNQQALCQTIARFHQNYPKMRLLLIVDQFEELYTLCPADCQPFLDQLLDAVQSAPALTLVLTLRADFYGYALSDRRFSDALQNAVYNLGPMSREELQRSIAQPAAQMQMRLEAGLTDKLIQSTWGHAGRLPLLEFALTELWLQQTAGWLTHQAYDAIGGVEEALANHAERVYAELHPLDQERMQRIFVQLVESEIGTDPSRRLATRDEVGETNWDLVSHLASARLVVTDRSELTGEETVEVVHEALLRNWGRLERWLQMDGEFRHWQEELRRDKRQWEGDREDDALLRGKRLLDAKYWYDTRPNELSSGDYTFIHYSLKAQERENKQRRRKRKVIVTSLIAGLLAALLLAAIAWWGWQNAAISEVRALSTSSNALFISNKRLDALVESLSAWQKQQRLAWVDSSITAQVEGALRQATYGANERNRLSGHQDLVYGVAFSPDNQLIATASGDKTVKLWQTDGTLFSTLTDHKDGVYGVTFSPDGELIATASLDKTVKLWKRDGTPLKTLQGHQGVVYAAHFSPNGEAIATASSDGQIKLWKRDGSLIRTFAGQSGAIYDVAFSPDGQQIAIAGGDGTVKLWQLDGTLIKTLSGHRDSVYRVVFSPDRQWIASAGGDNTIRLWTREGTLYKTFQGHSNRVFGIAFSPDSQMLASASRDKTVKLWRWDGSLLTTFTGHDAEVWAVAFSPDGQTLASASSDQSVRLWERDNSLLTTLVGHDEEIWAVAFSPNGQVVATASQDKMIKLWSLNSDPLHTFSEATSKMISVAFSSDGILAGAGQDQDVWFWRQDGTRLDPILRHGALINAIAFSPDGQIIATAGDDRQVKLWQRDGTLLQTLEGNRNDVLGVTFSPDGQVVAAAGRDKMIHLWTLDGTLIRRFNNHDAEARAIAFSPDGQVMAVASWDKTVKLWRPDGTFLKVLSGHEGKVNAVAFSSDGQMLASASDDQTIRLWRRDGELMHTLKGHSGRVNGIAFSPDQQTIASVSDDKTLILWHLNRVLDLHQLLTYSCDWVRDYLRTNQALAESDRQLCRGIGLE